ncbi:hypothetical protein BDA99DRAFT_433705 [Phascolomyces articulosus]|uniref:Uncharacterized protein n=1 Tax=Phascolomyces articulosus TaxID=60185 RepID=A0AAD5PH85_9FUNG|nr:hypothetical protein BDA99DRAFT_433705 [Phascolomyces articulosus]
MLRSNQQQQQQSPEYKVVIAYDFGTSCSGAAYAFTDSTIPEVFDVQNWPNKSGNFSPKIPTLSVYQRRNEQQRQSSERSSLSEWGYGAKKAMLKPHAAKQNILLSHFKLNLDESLQRPPLQNGLSPVQVVVDYLASLHQHTLRELSRALADSYDSDTFRYCLTVPAIWSDKSKHLIRQAAIQAGLVTPSDPPNRLILISDPEAAALYCVETMADQVQLNNNDRIMVCDAGGGTVDSIVFQVNFPDNDEANANEDASERSHNNPMAQRRPQLKEVTKGMGESCGSVFLDDRYNELLRAKLGTDVINKIYPREMDDLMSQFIDTIKPEFDGVTDQYVTLPRSVDLNELPANIRESDNGSLDEGVIELKAQELKEYIFDPVVDKVLSLIERQYQQIPDGQLNFLFLVGGFGSSRYLYERIRRVFQGTRVNQIICPAERAALAVVRGAAYYGIDPQVVVSRVSRRTYGITAAMPYEESIDPPSKRVVRANGNVQCLTRFFPYVNKNDELPVDYDIQQPMYITYGTIESTNIMLFATENDIIPRYHDEPGVHRVANISIPIPNIPHMNTGEHLYFNVR